MASPVTVSALELLSDDRSLLDTELEAVGADDDAVDDTEVEDAEVVERVVGVRVEATEVAETAVEELECFLPAQAAVAVEMADMARIMDWSLIAVDERTKVVVLIALKKKMNG